jgi:hypothetical protein
MLFSFVVNRMVVTREGFIMPTRLEWLGMLIMIGIFGFFAQVCISFHIFLPMDVNVLGRSGSASYGVAKGDRREGLDGHLHAGK